MLFKNDTTRAIFLVDPMSPVQKVSKENTIPIAQGTTYPPGINWLDDKVWEAIKQSGQWATNLKTGSIKMVLDKDPTPPKDAGPDTFVSQFAGIPSAQAIEIIKTCFNKVLLKKWLGCETSPLLQRELNEQLTFMDKPYNPNEGELAVGT